MGDVDVAVIGAGAAGLAAARSARDAGLSVVVLEARDRIGGRVYTVRPGGRAVELGAEFVHGRPRELLRIVEEAGLALVESGGSDWCVEPTGAAERCGMHAKIEPVIDAIMAAGGRDMTFREFVGGRPSSDELVAATSYVESFHAARTERIGVRYIAAAERAEKARGGDTSFRLPDGYDRVVARLADGLDDAIRLRTIVTNVRWRPGLVEVAATGRDGGRTASVVARFAIVTVPIGVLAAPAGARGRIRFDPEPRRAREALAHFEMGHAARVVFRFRSRVWDTERFAHGDATRSDLGFVFAPHVRFPVAWTHEPSSEATFTVWTGGPRAEALAGAGERPIVDAALASLGELLDVPVVRLRERIESVSTHDWGADPFSRGAYSYGGVGAVEAAKVLAEPVEATLLFAGEAFSPEGECGTVHGAIASGRRAAETVVRLAKAR